MCVYMSISYVIPKRCGGLKNTPPAIVSAAQFRGVDKCGRSVYKVKTIAVDTIIKVWRTLKHPNPISGVPIDTFKYYNVQYYINDSNICNPTTNDRVGARDDTRTDS